MVLHRKMKKTATSRFNASNRLMYHHRFSTWSLSIYSAGLIALSIMPLIGITASMTFEQQQFVQIVLALFVLIVSLQMSANDYSGRAERMHRCALDINRLCYRVLHYYSQPNDTHGKSYLRVIKDYDSILGAHENHMTIDFEMAMVWMTDAYKLSKGRRFWIRFRYSMHFWLYGLLLFLMFGAFGLIFV
nr:SLATT domain-containing protein [Ruficoccus amylovorans]